MGRRQHKRYRIALPVNITGIDGSGNRFAQSATTVDIGFNGAQLRGVRCLRSVGDAVEIQYKGKRARYRVAWIGVPGSDVDGHVGLRAVEAENNLFGDHLPQIPALEPDNYVIPTTVSSAARDSNSSGSDTAGRMDSSAQQQERRRHPRFNCAGTANILENGSAVSITGRVNELSLGGCYIEMMSPLRSGTSLNLVLDVSGRKVKVDGIVRNSQPTFGMGVEFIRMEPAEAEKLHALVCELSGGAPVLNKPSSIPSPQLLPSPSVQSRVAASAEGIASNAEIGEAVLRWFGTHDALTRDEFRRLTQTAEREQKELTHA